MKIAVCIKPVPDPKGEARIDPETKTVVRQGASVTDPLSRHALEAALTLREREGGEVVALSMAPESCQNVLREALALGADSAFLLSDRAFAGGDTLATANVLAAALRQLGPFDLLLFGAFSADGGTAQVAAQVGELLGLPHFHFVQQLNWEAGEFSFACDSGRELEQWACPSPLLLSVTRELNKPRYTTIRGLMAAKKKPLTLLGAAELAVAPELLGLAGSPTQNGEVYPMQASRGGQRIEGSLAEMAAQLLDKLRESGVSR